jgi:Tol biopolymer transport system component
MAPSWSPDGKLLAYARRDHGSTQIWLVPAAGGAARQVTHLVSDVEKLAWSPNGQALILAYRPGLAVAQKRLRTRD